jgi:hypothetical protein
MTRKFFLEPSADGLKRLGRFANDRMSELDDRSTISIGLLNRSFSGMDVIIVGRGCRFLILEFWLTVIHRRIEITIHWRRWSG